MKLGWNLENLEKMSKWTGLFFSKWLEFLWNFRRKKIIVRISGRKKGTNQWNTCDIWKFRKNETIFLSLFVVSKSQKFWFQMKNWWNPGSKIEFQPYSSVKKPKICRLCWKLLKIQNSKISNLNLAYWPYCSVKKFAGYAENCSKFKFLTQT